MSDLRVIQVFGVERVRRWRAPSRACAACDQPIERRASARLVTASGEDSFAWEEHAVHEACYDTLIDSWFAAGASVIGDVV